MVKWIKLDLEKKEKLSTINNSIYGLRNKIIRNRKIAGVIICLATVPYCFVNRSRIAISTQEVVATIKEAMHEPAQGAIPESVTDSVPEITPDSEPESVTDTAPEIASDSEPESVTDSSPEFNSSNEREKYIKFNLEDPDGYSRINDKEYKKLYKLIFYEDMDNLDDRVKSNIIIWLKSCTKNTPLDAAVTESGKSTEYFSNIEASFSNENGILLSSDLLDEVISGKKELLESYSNGVLAWNLANHMQTYALNYLNQTKDEKSILYFYMESIKYTQKTLEFDMDDKIKHERIRYLQARYKDIAECESIKEDVRLKAYKIYSAIQDAIDDLDIS